MRTVFVLKVTKYETRGISNKGAYQTRGHIKRGGISNGGHIKRGGISKEGAQYSETFSTLSAKITKVPEKSITNKTKTFFE